MHVISYCYKLGTYRKLKSKILAHSLPVLLRGSSIKFVPVRHSELLKVKQKYSEYDPFIWNFLINTVYQRMENNTTQLRV